MKKKETLFDILFKVSELRMDIETAEKRILRLFSVSNRYSLSYLDGQEFEQKTEIWAKDQDDALKQLKKICPNATYIFIRHL